METGTISQVNQANHVKNVINGFNATAPTSGSRVLGRDEFMKMLLTQLQHQDPMSVMKDEQFIAQLAQFSSLEEMQTMRKSFTTLLNLSQLTQVTGLIGKTVQLQSPQDGSTLITGMVSSVKMENGTPKLVVNGELFPLESVQSVK